MKAGQLLWLLLLLAAQPALPQTRPATLGAEAPVAPCATGASGPELPGGGGAAAIVSAIQRLIRYPTCWSEDMPWRGIITFTVRPDGVVEEAKMVRGFSYALDAAVLAAVRRLPRFVPYCCDGQPTAFTYTVPVFLRVPAHPYP